MHTCRSTWAPFAGQSAEVGQSALQVPSRIGKAWKVAYDTLSRASWQPSFPSSFVVAHQSPFGRPCTESSGSHLGSARHFELSSGNFQSANRSLAKNLHSVWPAVGTCSSSAIKK